MTREIHFKELPFYGLFTYEGKDTRERRMRTMISNLPFVSSVTFFTKAEARELNFEPGLHVRLKFLEAWDENRVGQITAILQGD